MMKVTKRKLQVISEYHPRDVADAEYDLLQDLGGMYSDMHKELYGRRPKIPMFKTVEEAEAAVNEIWGEYAAVNRAREAQEQADLEFIEMEQKMQDMMPGEYDYEHVPKRSGMGRRTEGKVSKRELDRLITEDFIYEAAKDFSYEGSAQQEIDDIMAAVAGDLGLSNGNDLEEHLIRLFIRAGHLSG